MFSEFHQMFDSPVIWSFGHYGWPSYKQVEKKCYFLFASFACKHFIDSNDWSFNRPKFVRMTGSKSSETNQSIKFRPKFELCGWPWSGDNLDACVKAKCVDLNYIESCSRPSQQCIYFEQKNWSLTADEWYILSIAQLNVCSRVYLSQSTVWFEWMQEPYCIIYYRDIVLMNSQIIYDIFLLPFILTVD